MAKAEKKEEWLPLPGHVLVEFRKKEKTDFGIYLPSADKAIPDGQIDLCFIHTILPKDAVKYEEEYGIKLEKGQQVCLEHRPYQVVVSHPDTPRLVKLEQIQAVCIEK